MQKSISIPPLFQHQIDFLKQNPDKSALVHSCGTGKTRTAIEWAKRGKSTALIITPKSLKTNWIRECERWGLHDYAVITKETFRRDVKDLPAFQQVIVDEIHNGFLTPNFKSQMSKALRWYLKEHNVKRFLACSATVYSSSPWNIFSLAYYLGHKWDYKKFDMTFFNYIRMGFKYVPVAKKGCEKKLAEMVKKIASVVDINDVMDVPLQHHAEPEYFSLTKEQQHAIEANYDPLPIVRYTGEHEIEQGVLLANEFRPRQEFSADKNERILELAKENPKLAIVCRYNAQIDTLASLLADYKPFIVRGDIKDRDSVCRAAEAAERAIVLIQADCAEGYQLPSFPLCIFASQSYSYVKYEQICGRFLRMDKPSRTTFMYLLTDGNSIDQAVYDSVRRKEDFKIALFRK